MRYLVTTHYERTVKAIQDPSRKTAIHSAVEELKISFKKKRSPNPGLGLKSLSKGVWEIRSNLADRILFYWVGNQITFLIAGNRNAIKRFLKDL